MFATAHNLSLFDLAWQGPLHQGYSLALLLYCGLLVWWFVRHLRQLRTPYHELRTNAEASLHELRSKSIPHDHAAWPAFLREHGLFELASAQEAGHPLPSFDAIQTRWLTRKLPLPPQSPVLLPLSTIQLFSLGSIGSLLGLLYTPANLWPLALWPAICGLLGGFLGTVLLQLLSRQQTLLQQEHALATKQHSQWLDDLWGQLPAPRRTRNGVQALESLQRSITQLIEAQTPQTSQDLLLAFTQQQEQTYQQLEQISQGVQVLSTLPERLHLLTEPLERADQSLQTWCNTLDQMEEKLQRFSRVLAEGLEPIAHSERLLSERIAALSRHYVALSDMLERIEQHERLLPQRTADLLKLSLRPAHQLLQRASLSLVRLLEQALNQQTRERESWRRLMGELNERLNSFDRLTHTHEKMNHELSNIADNLTELSTQIRFRPIIPTLNQEDTQNMSEALETEIEQLLNEGFRDIQAPPPHDPS